MARDEAAVPRIQHEPLPGSIELALNDFLQEQRDRLGETTFGKYLAIVELLESCLNGYGYESLSEIERRRFEKAFEDGDEAAFCHLFSPEKIPPQVPEFLYWFMLRKVMCGDELLRAASTVTKRLLKWLEERGDIEREATQRAHAVAKAAAHDLPASTRLTRLLGDIAAFDPLDFSPPEPPTGEVIEDLLTIEHVEPGALWFEGGIGPLEVPAEASELARPGWGLWAAVEKRPRGCRLLEHGIVYPERGFAL
jgi:hypothetical protein